MSYEKYRYTDLTQRLREALTSLTDPGVSNIGHSEAFQDLVQSGLEIRERQTKVTVYLNKQPAPRAKLVAAMLNNSAADCESAMCEASQMISAFRNQ